MNTATIKAKLLAFRAEIDELIEKVDAEEDGEADTPWMKVPAYAAWASVSADTVRRWVDEGLRESGAAVGRGKLTRIHRDNADAWRKSR